MIFWYKHSLILLIWQFEGFKQISWIGDFLISVCWSLSCWFDYLLMMNSVSTCTYAFWKAVLMLIRLFADDWIWISIVLDFRATARTEWEAWSVRLVLGGKPTTSSQVRFCQLSIMIELCSYILISKGSVLSVWTLVESVLTNDGQKKGQHAKMQVGWEV